ncbi:MAG: DNA polymerase I [Actinomycetota bacterium]
MADRTLLVLDGNSLTYRAFFGIPADMVTASGQVTNAVFGFTSMLLTVLKDRRPDGVIVAFDRPEPTFRHVAEPSYKAQREETPEILRQQMGIVKEVLAALGVTTIECSGFEADDIIATVTDRAVDAGFSVIIVTGDRDSYQLVRDPVVRVLYNKRGVTDYALYDEAGIVEKTGVHPSKYVEYAALRGDSSDNLPGVPGVGEKTAAKLINSYGDLDGIFAHASEQTPKLRESLTGNEAIARRNLDLMRLRHDAPIDVDLADSGVTPDMTRVDELFRALEFRTMGQRLKEVLGALGVVTASAEPSPSDAAPSGVLSAEIVSGTLDERVARVRTVGATQLHGWWSGAPGRSELLGVAVVVDADLGEVVWFDRGELVSIADWLGSVIHDGHDAKSLMRSLLDLGVDLRGLRTDTAIAAYLIDPAQSDYSVGEVLAKYTSYRFADDAGTRGELDLDGSAMSDAEQAGRAALAVSKVVEPLRAALATQAMTNLYEEIENPLVRILARMEHVGIAVDRDTLRSISERLTNETRELAERLQTIAGSAFNPNSPSQLGRILFDEKGLTPPKKTKTGYSTDAATLEKIRDEWPEFIDPLMRYREVDKLRGTYGEGLIAEVADDGRIHASFNQTVARTGRLSSDRPNLHNIPVRTDEGRVFRTAFVPAPGCHLLVADYNQIELRCIAHLADDPGLIAAFREGRDVHNATAARVFGVDVDAVSHEQRSRAKMVSYGLAYGMEAYGLGQRLGIPTGEASEILEAYFAAFPNVREYMDRTVAEAKTRGYTLTLFGRRRRIPELESGNFRVKQMGERQAMNAGIQGLAADIFKKALIGVDHALESGGFAARIVLQVHDEVIVEVPTAEVDAVGPLVLGIMENCVELKVPLAVNSAWGDSWAAAKG